VSDRRIDEQLTKYLTDVHSIEEQALTQMRRAPKIAGSPELAQVFERHLVETEEHELLVREALEARGAEPSTIKDVAGRIGGWGMLAFAESQVDSPGKLVAHAYSYEHMEQAAYELLARVAERGGEPELVALAEKIGANESEMAARLEDSFDLAVELSLADAPGDDVDSHLNDYLADAHALEMQALQLLSASPALVEDAELKALFADHRQQTEEHERRVRERLEARGASTSKVKDAALRLGGLNIGGFFAAQPDTPIKLVGFAFAFEHIEAAAYELLRRVAERAGDTETAAVAESILAEEREQGERARSLFDRAAEAGLAAQGVTA
jgi:ferritin-like metal-binding protein YciE